MEIEDFYKIIVKLEKEQERLSKLQAEIIEKIALTNAAQNKDLVKISNNQDVLSKQLNNLITSKNASDSPELTKVLNAIHSNLNRLEQARNAFAFKFWCVVVLIVAFLGLIEWQVFNQPEKVWQWYVEHNQANQSKRTK